RNQRQHHHVLGCRLHGEDRRRLEGFSGGTRFNRGAVRADRRLAPGPCRRSAAGETERAGAGAGGPPLMMRRNFLLATIAMPLWATSAKNAQVRVLRVTGYPKDGSRRM